MYYTYIYSIHEISVIRIINNYSAIKKKRANFSGRQMIHATKVLDQFIFFNILYTIKTRFQVLQGETARNIFFVNNSRTYESSCNFESSLRENFSFKNE